MPFPSGNRILDALPPADAQRLAPQAHPVSLERAQSTTVHSTRMQTVDFPVTALLAVMGTLENGTTYELASVGTEGFVEVDAALESVIALRSATCQFPGEVVRFPIDAFTDALRWSPAFSRLVRHAVRARIFVTEQSVMCNLRHTIEERLSRWLLQVRERLRRDDFNVTHEFLSSILGARRAGVSTAAAALQSHGAIDYSRGLVVIRDVARLEASSCECYAICRDTISEATRPEAD